MELIKKNIHMDRIKAEAVSQFTVEDDVNIPDSKPDVNSLNMSRGEVVVEEIKPGSDCVTVRGKLMYAILYHTLEDNHNLVTLEGGLPFEEKVILRGVSPTDSVSIDSEVEDLTVGMINSRKLNIQSLVTMTAGVEEIYDEEIPVALRGDEKVEYRKMPLELAQVAICKNDVFRLKEEINLPSNYPNILRMLWNTVTLGDVECKVSEEKLSFSGDIHVFILYQGEGEERPIRSYETTLPFSGVLDCHGCKEGMIPNICCTLGQKELAVRPDFDGEERCVGLELVLDFRIRIYEEDCLEVITDIYGVSNEIDTQSREATLKHLLAGVTGKTKITDRMHVKSGNVLQLLHSEASVIQDHRTVVENGILLQGNLHVKAMYVTGEDEAPYSLAEARIPYQYTLDIPGLTVADAPEVRAEVEQLQVTVLDGEELDVKAVLCFSTVAFHGIPMSLISRVQVSPLDTGKLSNLPGMVIYMIKEGDNLWNIGKQYYVPVERLRQLNHMESDEIRPGQKLLVVKGS